jgi:hypothetical protein
MMVQTLKLAHATVEIDHEARKVTTRLPGGLSCPAVRDDTPENRHQAVVEQGYPDGPDACWHSLVDHEILHSLLSDLVYAGPSPTLVHEAGGEGAPLHLRYHEEATCLAFQRYLNTGEVHEALSGYYEHLRAWRLAFALTRQRVCWLEREEVG